MQAKQRGTTVMLITHRPTIAAKCDRILMLREGQIEMYGAGPGRAAEACAGQCAGRSRRGRTAPPQPPA